MNSCDLKQGCLVLRMLIKLKEFRITLFLNVFETSTFFYFD